MTTYLPRAAWTSTKASGSSFTDAPVGPALHWPGATVSYRGKTQAQVALILEAIRRFHVGGRGWADIAYQVCVDQAGRVWDLRGITRKSAANGDSHLNAKHGAVLLLLGPGDPVTPEMALAFTDWRRDVWLKQWPDARALTTHGAIRAGGTDCPGIAATVFASAHQSITPAPAPTPEDDMPLDANDRIFLWQKGILPEMSAEEALREVVLNARQTQGKLDRVLATLDPTSLSAAVAAGVAAAGGAQVDVDALARAIVVELGKS